ncbi:winged helix-turn-helix transcriptional regulator [Leifsonia poae]|uniref:winged helix-turn-helix transcriptional regulator n=1 Tax=Leifsonia poae TaxID=110933 RepID=UPI003D67D122
MNSTTDALLSHGSSAGAILDLIRSGHSRSRAEIARSTGLSPTTVAQRIDALIDAGYLREAGRASHRAVAARARSRWIRRQASSAPSTSAPTTRPSVSSISRGG